MTDTDSQWAEAHSEGINIDQTPPQAHVVGANYDAHYAVLYAPVVTCGGDDALSGAIACRLSHRTTGVAGGRVVNYAARVTDRAGNTATADKTIVLDEFGVANAAYDGGAYRFRRGRTYSFAVVSRTQPRIARPVASPDRPHVLGATFHQGSSAWPRDAWFLTTGPIALRPGVWDFGVYNGVIHQIRVIVTD